MRKFPPDHFQLRPAIVDGKYQGYNSFYVAGKQVTYEEFCKAMDEYPHST